MLVCADRDPSSDAGLHQPVMVEPIIELLLKSAPDGSLLQGTVVDGTVGGGGHAQAVLENLSPQGRFIGFDRDPQALQTARKRFQGDHRVTLVHDTYSRVAEHLPVASVSAFLLDLGLSSDQLESGRGFSFNRDDPLDMRYDPQSEITAYDIVNRYSISKLRDIFFRYGEEPLSPRIARRIGEVRKSGAVRTTRQLNDIIEEAVPERFRTKAAARIFQALRIEVNREIEQLERGLEAAWTVLRPGGVLCVVSYHSIEDRRVKRFMAQKAKGCICPPQLPFCACGKKPSAEILTPSALRPSPKEKRLNPRSRSAKLRAALKIEGQDSVGNDPNPSPEKA